MKTLDVLLKKQPTSHINIGIAPDATLKKEAYFELKPATRSSEELFFMSSQIATLLVGSLRKIFFEVSEEENAPSQINVEIYNWAKVLSHPRFVGSFQSQQGFVMPLSDGLRHVPNQTVIDILSNSAAAAFLEREASGYSNIHNPLRHPLAQSNVYLYEGETIDSRLELLSSFSKASIPMTKGILYEVGPLNVLTIQESLKKKTSQFVLQASVP